MKNTLSFVVSIVFLTLFSLNLSAQSENRESLEKVIKHYSQNKNDSLKLKAAKFLIENMEAHFFPSSKGLDKYNDNLVSIFSLNDRSEKITKQQDSLFQKLTRPRENTFNVILDSENISSDILISNIDQAFKAWDYPWSKKISFDDFCEYLLPYKVLYEKPDHWRTSYKNSLYKYVQHHLDTIINFHNSEIINCPFEYSLQDVSKNNNKIGLSGNENYHSVLGKIAFKFDDSNSISLPNNLFEAVSDITISTWILIQDQVNDARFFDFSKNESYYLCSIPYYNGKSILQVKTREGSTRDISIDSLPINQWTQISITFFQNYLSLYIDGIHKGSINTDLEFKELVKNNIGKSSFDKEPMFEGLIHKFRMHSRELNSTELCAIADKDRNQQTNEQIIQDLARRVSNLYNVKIEFGSLLYGGHSPFSLVNLKKGTCLDYAILATYLFRSLGIPTGIDFTPQWANRSMGHSWNILHIGEGKMKDYAFNGGNNNVLGEHINRRREKKSKIFRRTYSIQKDTPGTYWETENIPQELTNPCIKDVTEQYIECADFLVVTMKTI